MFPLLFERVTHTTYLNNLDPKTSMVVLINKDILPSFDIFESSQVQK